MSRDPLWQWHHRAPSLLMLSHSSGASDCANHIEQKYQLSSWHCGNDSKNSGSTSLVKYGVCYPIKAWLKSLDHLKLFQYLDTYCWFRVFCCFYGTSEDPWRNKVEKLTSGTFSKQFGWFWLFKLMYKVFIEKHTNGGVCAVAVSTQVEHGAFSVAECTYHCPRYHCPW